MTSPHPRIYLDNAATSFPKPPEVLRAVRDYLEHSGVAVGRGAYRRSVELQAEVQRCRQRVAQLLGAESPERIIFTHNGTDSLNLALHGLLRHGDHVITTALEHNSVLRPLRELEARIDLEFTCLPLGREGVVDPEDFRRALRKNTRLLVLTQASNVTGRLQPVEAVGAIAREAGLRFLVDGAQAAGHVPINLRQSSIDLWASPGHKGLLGLLGTGVLYLKPGLEQEVLSTRQGGTGTKSEEVLQPESLPDKYESGNHNAPGLVGLSAGVGWLLSQEVTQLRQQELELLRSFLEGLRDIPLCQVHGTGPLEEQLGLISLTSERYDPQTLATLLEDVAGVEVRAGLHCAPEAHRSMRTLQTGGTVRFSLSPFTTPHELDVALRALRALHAA